MSRHIYQRGGRWVVTVDVGSDPLTHKRQRISRTLETGATRTDAKHLADELVVRHRSVEPSAAEVTVRQAIEAWYRSVEPDLSPTTRQGYRSKIDVYLAPAFGDMPLRKLTAAKIDALYRRLRREGKRGNPLSPATLRRLHAALSSACGQAVKWGWISSNPCDRATVPRQVRREVEPPSIAEIENVLAHAGEDLREAAGLAIATGARRGELCGLQWADVDLDAGAVTIRRSIGDVAGEPVVIEDRRKSLTRTVAIDPVTVEMLKMRRARHAELALACGVGLEDAGYVLGEEPGQNGPLPPQLISQRWRLAAKRAGVAARFHDLRHWHVTELLAAGIPVANVRARAGWASDAMLRVYAHALSSLDREAADIIAAKLAR